MFALRADSRGQIGAQAADNRVDKRGRRWKTRPRDRRMAPGRRSIPRSAPLATVDSVDNQQTEDPP